MRRMLIGAALAASLCGAQAARAQSNTAVGAGAGVVAGALVAGPVGAVVGGLVGAAWGESTKPRRRHAARRRAVRAKAARAIPAPKPAPPARVAQRAPAGGSGWVNPR